MFHIEAKIGGGVMWARRDSGERMMQNWWGEFLVGHGKTVAVMGIGGATKHGL